MTRLSTLYGAATSIRRDRPLTLDELMRVAPGIRARCATCLNAVCTAHYQKGRESAG